MHPPPPPQHSHQHQQPMTVAAAASHSRRTRRTSAADSAPLVTQLTRGLTRTYNELQPMPPAPARVKPQPASAGSSAATVAAAAPAPAPRKTKTSRNKKTTSEPSSSVTATTTPSSSSSSSSSHRRLLTKKTKPMGNNGLDNEEQNLIVRARDVFGGRDALPVQPEFMVLDLLGQGTFGQVFRCQNTETKELVAIKVIRNHPSYYKQAIVEVQITRLLNASFTEDEAPHFVRLKDTFEFRHHLCLVFELLSINVYELIAENNFNGFPLDVTRGFQQQILHALVRMDEIGVIHCDLKPENILLVGQDQCLSDVVYRNDPQMTQLLACTSSALAPGGGGTSMPTPTPYIKVVDFGSACMENETVYSYIQSRFYRSPEVLLGIAYTGSIDLWSLGCIAVEMFLGLPLFPGVSEHDQLRLIEATLGPLPQELLRKGRNVLKFYNVARSERHHSNRFVLKTPEEFARDTNAEVQVSKKYFKYTKLDDMVHAYPYPKHLSELQRRVEFDRRDAFLHFVRGLLCVDPLQRWSARAALRHPFLTGAPFDRECVVDVEQYEPTRAMPTSLLCVVAPHRFESYVPTVEQAWPSPVTHFHDLGEPLATHATSPYSDRIWGPLGMPAYALERSLPQPQQYEYEYGDEHVSPTGGVYYTQHHHHNHHAPYPYDPPPSHHGPASEKPRTKVVPTPPTSSSSSHGLDGASQRVYPYDPYSDTAAGYQPKAYVEDHDGRRVGYSPSSAPYASSHYKVTPTSSSDGFPVVPLSPYEVIQSHDFDAPYYAPLAPGRGGEGGGGGGGGVEGGGSIDWPWGDPRYEVPPSMTTAAIADDLGAVDRGMTWTQHDSESALWQRDDVPRHHQYMPDTLPPSQPPPRRGKRQHTNSWDSGDTRELRRHETAHPQSTQAHVSRPGYAHQQPPQRVPGSGTGGHGSGSGTHGRVQSTPRKHDHKGRSAGTTRPVRKSPKGAVVKTPQHQQPPESQPQLHNPYVPQRSVYYTQHGAEAAASYDPYQLQSQQRQRVPYAAAVAKRDDTTGVCSVEEKFSSVMSLDLPSIAAVPLPT